MPFVKKNDSQGSQPSTNALKIFIGRTDELHFFVENILQSENPSHNIISISGQGGVGKSTLLARFIGETRSSNFKDYCLTALVDERQSMPISIMEKFADQLRLKGTFEKALRQYKETLRKLHAGGYAMQGTILHGIPDFAGAVAETVPIAGPLLREGMKAGTKHLLERYHTGQTHRDAEILGDPLAALTKAFIEELNSLVENRVAPRFRRVKQLRVILFLDTFEQLAADTVPWLLDYFLEAEIKNTVVLVIAGRDALEQSTPDGPKRWLPYHDNHTIYSIFLDRFTKEETRLYLAERSITDPDRVSAIWHLSQGLPLYLGLLTSNSQGKVDPTANVVANFLRWIPEQEYIKQRLALDAALFSRSFNQDDLEAFEYVPEHERPALYRWLIGQPFVRSQDGRYSYHDLAKELFSRHLYQNSKKEYSASRRALARHYQRLLDKVEQEEGKEIYRSTEWFGLILALISQLFLLPDEASHIKAITQVLAANRSTDYARRKEIARVLQGLSSAQIDEISPRAVQVIRHLYHLIGPFPGRQKLLEASTFLLNIVMHEPSFPAALLGRLYASRGAAYAGFYEHQRAIDDFQRHLTLLDPADHRNRGGAYWDLEEYQQAIREFNLVLEQNPYDFGTLGNRGWNYYYLKEYQRAIDDFEYALELNPNDVRAHSGRGCIHEMFKEYNQALTHFQRIIEVDPTDSHGYHRRGWMYVHLKEYQRAIADFEYALELHPTSSYYAYYLRGYAYLWLKDMKRALADFTQSWELMPTIRCGWVAEWTKICQQGFNSNTPERLEMLIAMAAHPTDDYPRVCRGVVLLLQEHYEEALAELEQATPLSQDLEPWDAHFWKGMTCAFLEREEEAMEAIQKALEEGMPPVLLAPLCWFEQERHDFYEKYVVPLLTKHE